jgi:hypothetical protein
MLAWLSDLNWWGACGALVGGGIAIAVVHYALKSNAALTNK